MKFFSGNTKHLFLAKNILHGLLWLVIIVVAFTLLSNYISDSLKIYITEWYSNSSLFYSVFTFSELFFGLIPPEFFMMIYILNHISLTQFIINLLVLTLISYAAGVIDYMIGRQFSNYGFVKKIDEQFLAQYRPKLKKYGAHLLIAGAITPLPFSAVCMLMGITRFPVYPFLLVTLFRILRFAVYGWIMWSIPTAFGSG